MTMRVLIQYQPRGTLDKIEGCWVWSRPDGYKQSFGCNVALHDVNAQIAARYHVRLWEVQLRNIE